MYMKEKTIYVKNKGTSTKKGRQSLLQHKVLYVAICLFIVVIGVCFLVVNNYYHSQKSVKPTGKRVIAVSQSFTETYMQDLLEKKYAQIWNLFAPSYQATILKAVGKNAYLSFLQHKFSDIHYGNISMTACESGQTVFPYGVERSYKDTCVSNVTMNLTTSNASVSSQLSSFEDLPVIFVKSGKKYQIVGGGPTDIQAPVLYPPYPVVNTIHVPIVMYHLIQPIPLRSHYESTYAWRLDVGLTVTPQAFANQIGLLQEQGYHPISPNDLFNNLYYNLPIPSKPIILSFDDGRISDFTNGLPILLQYHYPAIFFIPPALTGKIIGLDGHNTYMTYSQLKILTSDGMYVENHSLYHTLPLWQISPSSLQLQLSEANSDLYNTTHYPVQYIAYDGSWPTRNWEKTTPAIERTMTVLSSMGFTLAFQDTGNNVAIEKAQLPYQLPRIRGVNSPAISFITNAIESAQSYE